MNRLLLDPQANSPTANPNTRQGFDDNAYFDTNMVIILSVLLCALICALSLNSILRCLLKCTQRFNSNDDVDNLEETRIQGSRNENSGIKKHVLKRIPVESYGLGIDMKASECLICLGEFVEGEKVRVLPKCSHGFHVRCIDTWLLTRSSCPTCRQSLFIESPPPVAAPAAAAVMSGPMGGPGTHPIGAWAPTDF